MIKHKSLLLWSVLAIVYLIWIAAVYFNLQALTTLALPYAPDGNIERPLFSLFLPLVLLPALTGLAILLPRLLWPQISRSDNLWTDFQIRSNRIQQTEIVLLVMILLIHFLSLMIFPALRVLYQEDHVLEYLSAAMAFAAGLVLIFTRHTAHLQRIRLAIRILAIFLIFYSLEEISWGQRIFQIKSPEFFKANNYQQETTLHNFFNPLFGWTYCVISSVAAWVYYRFEKIAVFLRDRIDYYPNQPNARSLTLLMLFMAVTFLLNQVGISTFGLNNNELLEELLCVLVLFQVLDFRNCSGTTPQEKTRTI